MVGRAKGRGRGRGRPRGRGRGRGRPKKAMVIESDEEELVEEPIETSETVDNTIELTNLADVLLSKPIPFCDPVILAESLMLSRSIEAQARLNDPSLPSLYDSPFHKISMPSFSMSTISSFKRPEVMMELDWSHPYTPLGERVINPNIHMCKNCRLPIRIYGRLIPCKHVMCYDCALSIMPECKHICPRCDEKVHRVERNPVGSLFMCLHEGERYGYYGCRRTYLSQRDLQAHINHRHKPRNPAPIPPPRSSFISSHPGGAPHNQFHGNTTKAKADSQSHSSHGIYGSSPDRNLPSSSTGPRYDRERDRNRGSYSQHSHSHHRSNSSWSNRPH